MTVTSLRPRLHSPRRARTTLGAKTMSDQVLDVIERLLLAAQHPDIAAVTRYGPGDGPWGPSVNSPGMKGRKITGVKVTHQSTATASLWLAIHDGETPVEAPAVLPPLKQNRAPRLLILTAQLLDVAQPEQFKAWRLVALPGVGRPDTQAGLPFGLSIVTADGSKVLLRATATGPTLGDEPTEEPCPEYVIPEGVKACLSGSSTTRMSPCPTVGAASAGRS